MKILILGHGRHGKDTVAETLGKLMGLTFLSSSWAACEKAVFPWLSQLYGYSTAEECFNDRAAHRLEWKQLITDYNTPDKGKLCREILALCDGYVGMRCPDEYAAVQSLFDAVVWVDASRRLPPDPSMAIPYSDDMWLIDNNGPEADLPKQLQPLIDALTSMRAQP